MIRFFKTIVLLILVSGNFFSCYRSYDPYEMEYNKLIISGFDNSNTFTGKLISIDRFYPEAVAIKLTLEDSAYSWIKHKNIKKTLPAEEQREEVPPTFVPKYKVLDIQIITRTNINEFIKAGDDVTNLFLYSTGDSFEMYHAFNEAINKLNGLQQNDNRGSILLVLKTAVLNKEAQFEVKVVLDNYTELIETSTLFTIIQM